MTEMDEQARQRMPRVSVVFYQQDPQPLWRARRSARVQISFSDFFWHGVESDLESGAETAATALGFNCSVVKINKMFGDGEAQTESTKLAGHRSISLFE